MKRALTDEVDKAECLLIEKGEGTNHMAVEGAVVRGQTGRGEVRGAPSTQKEARF